jgi:hypothetical protein
MVKEKEALQKQIDELEKQEQLAKSAISSKRPALDPEGSVQQVLGAQKCTVYDRLTEERRQKTRERRDDTPSDEDFKKPSARTLSRTAEGVKPELKLEFKGKGDMLAFDPKQRGFVKQEVKEEVRQVEKPRVYPTNIEEPDWEDGNVTMTRAEFVKMRESMRREMIREFDWPRSAISESNTQMNFAKVYNTEAEARLIEQAIERNMKNERILRNLGITEDIDLEEQHRLMREYDRRKAESSSAAAAAASSKAPERVDQRTWNDLNATSQFVKGSREWRDHKAASRLEQDLARETDKREKHRVLYEHNLDRNGYLKPSEKAKYADNFAVAEVQRRCKHEFKRLNWGANGSAIWAHCLECNLHSVVSYNKGSKHIYTISQEVIDEWRMRARMIEMDLIQLRTEESQVTVHYVHMDPGYIMIDTGCKASVAGQEWHDNMTQMVERHGLGGLIQEIPQNEKFRFGDGRSVLSSCRRIYPTGIRRKLYMLSVSVVEGACPGLMSYAQMQALAVVISVRDQQVELLGEWGPLVMSNSRHPLIRLDEYPVLDSQTSIPINLVHTTGSFADEVTAMAADANDNATEVTDSECETNSDGVIEYGD